MSGVKRRSGRYRWGSGEEPYQSIGFLGEYKKLKEQNLSDTEIANAMGITTSVLRTKRTWARKEEKQGREQRIHAMKEAGLSNTAIAKLENVSEGTIRNMISPKEKHQSKQLEGINKALVQGVENTGYLDVGVGVELQLGVPRTRFNNVVNKMVMEDGYYIHRIFVDRLNDKMKPITMKVLTKEEDMMVVKMNQDKIRPLDSWSDNAGEDIYNINPPSSVNPNRLVIRYKEDGGDGKDGLIEMRPGVKDLDMGASHYAQVRIKVGDERFLKGMAVYGDDKDFPKGVDLIFNTNKGKDIPKMEVLKKLKVGTDNIFGSSITRQNETNTLNIVNEEGEWDTWSTGLSSQFLSKQPLKFVKERLDKTYETVAKEYDEIDRIDNPIVKQHLMEAYSGSLESKAKKLSAQGIPKTKSHVILPFPDMNPNEIYAPRYNNEDRVVLLRYPHGGTFELPEVTVNNKNVKARKVLGNAPDAIGIHPSVAAKLSGADFDGDTVYVLPNNNRQIKTSRTLKELKNFDPMDYKVDHETISPKYKQKQMGLITNLITDMQIKGAPDADIAKAVRHSMVVIDSEKHKLDYKQSARDNNISALKKKYQTHIHLETGKESQGASTIISRSKKRVDIADPNFKAEKLSSGREVEGLYVGYIDKLQSLKGKADKSVANTIPPKYDKDAAKVYKEEIESLNKKLNIAKLNAPRERQAQILSNKLYYSNLTPDMDKDQIKKLKNRSLARARQTTGSLYIKADPTTGKKTKKSGKQLIDITPQEWEAIEVRAVSNNKLKEILKNSDMEQVKKYATPRESKVSSAKGQQAQNLLNNNYTYAEVASKLGISVSAIRGLIHNNIEN